MQLRLLHKKPTIHATVCDKINYISLSLHSKSMRVKEVKILRRKNKYVDADK